jgi:hypothetical protein
MKFVCFWATTLAARILKIPARLAAHLSYALHNEALAVIEGKTFDVERAIEKIRSVDKMFGESVANRYEALVSNEKT